MLTLVAPGSTGGRILLSPKPATVSDLTAVWSGISDLLIEYTQPDNSAFERMQHRAPGGTWSVPKRVENVFIDNFEDSSVNHEIRVWGVSARGREATKSNVATFTTYTPSIVLRDTKFATYVGVGAGITSLNLNSMNAGASLDRIAGNLVVVGAHLTGAGTVTGIGTEAVLTENWNNIDFAAQATGQQAGASRAAMKVWDGSETGVIDLIDHPAATGNVRVIYWAKSYNISGLPELKTTVVDPITPYAQVTANDPALITIPSGGEGDPVLVINANVGNASLPAVTTTGAAPTTNETYAETVTVAAHLRLLTWLFPADVVPVDVTSNPNDAGGVNTRLACVIVMRVPS